MDKADRILLEELQADSRRPIVELAEHAGLSSSACHRHIRMLESEGYIEGYGARLDPERLGLGLHALVEISLTRQSREAMNAFEDAVGRFDDILSCDLTSGAADYVIRVAAPDLAAFDDIHRNCLAQLPGVSAMRTSFVIRQIKPWRGYPVPER